MTLNDNGGHISWRRGNLETEVNGSIFPAWEGSWLLGG